mgnify:FL=1
MIEILLIIILLVCLNILRAVKAPTTTKKDVKEVILIQERLKDFVHQRCEIVLQEPSWMIDIAYSTIGVIQDYDDEWLMIVIQKSKKEIKKVIRISQIKDIKEIKEK